MSESDKSAFPNGKRLKKCLQIRRLIQQGTYGNEDDPRFQEAAERLAAHAAESE